MMLGGGLCVVRPKDRILKTLRITGLIRVIPPFDDLPKAFAWLDADHAVHGTGQHDVAGIEPRTERAELVGKGTDRNIESLMLVEGAGVKHEEFRARWVRVASPRKYGAIRRIEHDRAFVGR